jgi:hypothetical protein
MQARLNKKKSLIQAIVPEYINGLSGPNSVYLLGVGWEVWDKAARLLWSRIIHLTS